MGTRKVCEFFQGWREGLKLPLPLRPGKLLALLGSI